MLETTLLVALGFYWIGIYLAARKMQASERLQKWSWRGIWILPVALSIDNLTYGAVTGVPAHASVWASAGLQALYPHPNNREQAPGCSGACSS